MFCTNCGKSVPSGNKFCTNCGSKGASEYYEPTSSQRRIKATEVKRTERRWRAQFIVGMMVILLVFAGAIFVTAYYGLF